MSPIQVGLVRDTFEGVREAPGPILMLFYGRLFDLDPSLRPLFKIDIASQSQKLADMLVTIVNSLDRLEQLRPTLREMGKRHVEYGVKPEHYQTLTTAMIWALGQALSPHFDRDAKEAWRLALTAVAQAMTED